MNLKGLRAFTLIMAKGTLADAAKAMHLSQSSVSRHLSLLEAEIGIALFTRKHRRLTPTPEAEAFYREARRILYGIEEIPRITDRIKHGPRRHLRVVTMPRMAACITAPAISRLMEKDPHVQVSVDVQPHQLLQHWVAGHQFDLGIGFLPAVHAAIRTEAIGRMPTVVVMHPDHPLAGRESVTITDMAPYPLVAMAPGTLIRHQTDMVFAAARIPLRPQIEVSAMILACNLVAQGYGYTISDPMMPTTLGEGALVAVPLVPRVDVQFGFLYPRDDIVSPVAEDFSHIVRQVAEEFIRDHGYDRWPPGN